MTRTVFLPFLTAVWEAFPLRLRICNGLSGVLLFSPTGTAERRTAHELPPLLMSDPDAPAGRAAVAVSLSGKSHKQTPLFGHLFAKFSAGVCAPLSKCFAGCWGR